MSQGLRRVRAAVRLGLAAIAALALLGQLSCSTSSSGGSDPIPPCSEDGAACGPGRVCHVDDDDLCGGYCSPTCSACPVGTKCVDSPDLCAAVCTVDADCPRPYQICDEEGACTSDENQCPG